MYVEWKYSKRKDFDSAFIFFSRGKACIDFDVFVVFFLMCCSEKWCRKQYRRLRKQGAVQKAAK